MKQLNKSRMILISILFLIAVVFIGGCRKAGLWLVKEDPIEHADAIVMLIGALDERISQVADLYEQQVSGTILMVKGTDEYFRAMEEKGMVRRVTIARNAFLEHGIPNDSIITIPADGVSTLWEAIGTRDYLATKPMIDTILVVSSAPHLRRAYIIFSKAFQQLEKPVEILCCPSSYSSFNAEKWWWRKEDIRWVVMEYLKLANFILFDKKELRD